MLFLTTRQTCDIGSLLISLCWNTAAKMVKTFSSMSLPNHIFYNWETSYMVATTFFTYAFYCTTHAMTWQKHVPIHVIAGVMLGCDTSFSATSFAGHVERKRSDKIQLLQLNTSKRQLQLLAFGTWLIHPFRGRFHTSHLGWAACVIA